MAVAANVMGTSTADPVKSPQIFTIQFEINDACNLRCIHCYHGNKVIKESPVTLERLFEDVEALHQKLGPDYQILIRLSGGEVFVRKDLMDLLLKILIKGYATIMLTNGTMVTPENAWEVLVRGVALAQVSLDGPNAAIHDQIRGKGQFEKALQGIRTFVETGQPVSVSYTMMHGLNDGPAHFRAMLDLARQEHIFKVSFSRIFPQGDGLNIPQYAYADGPHYKQVLEDLLEVCRDYPDLRLAIKDPLARNLETPFPNHVNLDICCYIKRDYISVAADGSVYACRKLGQSVGHLMENSLLEIWENSTLLQQMADRHLYIKGKCQTCPIQMECRGGCLAASYGVTGQLFVPDPACWREEPAM